MANELSKQNNNSELTKNFTIEDFKALYYKLNAKPDTQIKLLNKKRAIQLANITDLNDRVIRKLNLHDTQGNITSLNFILDSKIIKDYASWTEFERERWHTINQKIISISISWDFNIKIAQYELPQRHMLKLKIGQTISPQDMFQIAITSDNAAEVMEMEAAAVIKIDFINQTLASELIQLVADWYEGLPILIEENKPSALFRKWQQYILNFILRFTPIFALTIFILFFEKYNKWVDSTNNITLANIFWLLIIIISIYHFFTFVGKYIADIFDKLIDSFIRTPQFCITKGDENAALDAKNANSRITKNIIVRFILYFSSVIIAVIAKHYIADILFGANG